ncbi:hypothetical protein Y1Q_0018777 [Alligator mississippiensis]|uniref:Uncharacterized protein n=1 Tax=Alligator mississippiensis TaxID=8496 RepID=A0A151NSD2_ALLMI|nr:hypothetical protein Y1Q_0018777 [Alligator mississippiensis]
MSLKHNGSVSKPVLELVHSRKRQPATCFEVENVKLIVKNWWCSYAVSSESQPGHYIASSNFPEISPQIYEAYTLFIKPDLTFLPFLSRIKNY